MLELRQHMCMLCKMYIRQEKAVTEQGVILTRAPMDKMYATESKSISSTLHGFYFGSCLEFLFQLLSVDCDQGYVSQYAISFPKLFQIFIIAIET